MKKLYLATLIAMSLFTQETSASFSDSRYDSIPTGAAWRRITSEQARQKTFDMLEENGNYKELAALKKALISLDENFSKAFRDRLNTNDYDTYAARKAELDEQEKALLEAAQEIVPAYDNPPPYEEPMLPDYDQGNWNDTPEYEEEDWSDTTGWVKVNDRDLAGYYQSPEYEQSLGFDDEE